MADKELLFETVLRLADDHLILGHRLSEWCGHAPMLEEDLAMPNIALDLIGQARSLYTYAGEVEAKGRDEDQLAYLRLEKEYKNLLLTELPNGDFAHTMLRQLYFSVFMELFWSKCQNSSDQFLADLSAKAVKETIYHVRHSTEWIIRLGDGTDESRERTIAAIEFISPYTTELFAADELAEKAAVASLIPLVSDLKPEWDTRIKQIFEEAYLPFDPDPMPKSGGRQGRHLEDMGYLLADLQYMQRTYPNMSW